MKPEMDDDGEWLTPLKDLSQHIWHGKIVMTVSHEVFEGWVGDRIWDAIEVLDDFPGWDICKWHYWETNTLFEISWSATSKESRDAVAQCLRGMGIPYAKHIYEACVPCGRTIEFHHWREV